MHPDWVVYHSTSVIEPIYRNINWVLVIWGECVSFLECICNGGHFFVIRKVVFIDAPELLVTIYGRLATIWEQFALPSSFTALSINLLVRFSVDLIEGFSEGFLQRCHCLFSLFLSCGKFYTISRHNYSLQEHACTECQIRFFFLQFRHFFWTFSQSF